jgi:hypothetical protein
VDPRAGLDDMEKWKFFTLPVLELPPPLVVQPVASRYTDWAIPAPICNVENLFSPLCAGFFFFCYFTQLYQLLR